MNRRVVSVLAVAGVLGGLMAYSSYEQRKADNEAIVRQMAYLGTTNPDEAFRFVDNACELVGSGNLESEINQLFTDEGQVEADWAVDVVNIATERKCPQYRDEFVTIANSSWSFDYK